MRNPAVVPLIVHGRILWWPAGRTDDPEPAEWFPLTGEVRFEHLLLARPVDLDASAACPVTAAALSSWSGATAYRRSAFTTSGTNAGRHPSGRPDESGDRRP